MVVVIESGAQLSCVSEYRHASFNRCTPVELVGGRRSAPPMVVCVAQVQLLAGALLGATAKSGIFFDFRPAQLLSYIIIIFRATRRCDAGRSDGAASEALVARAVCTPLAQARPNPPILVQDSPREIPRRACNSSLGSVRGHSAAGGA